MVDRKFNAYVPNIVFQSTSDPQTMAISIDRQNFAHRFIKESRTFDLSILYYSKMPIIIE